MASPVDADIRRSGRNSTVGAGTTAPGVPVVPLRTLLRNRDRVVLAGLVGYAALMAIWFAIGARDGELVSSLRLLATQLLTLISGALALQASRSRSLDHGARRFWMAVFVSQVIVLALAFAEQLTLRDAPHPVRLVAPLLVHLVLFVGLLQLPSAPRSALDRVKLTLDCATVIVGGMLVLWFDYFAAARGSRLPSVRQCAQQQKVSPSTVVAAYDQLLAQGLVEARKNRGFYVREMATARVLGEQEAGNRAATGLRSAKDDWPGAQPRRPIDATALIRGSWRAAYRKNE